MGPHSKRPDIWHKFVVRATARLSSTGRVERQRRNYICTKAGLAEAGTLNYARHHGRYELLPNL